MSQTVNWPSILRIEAGSTITEKMVEANYRTLAKKLHPDAGESTESMTQLNLAKPKISRAKFLAIAATTANGKPTFLQLGMNGAFRA